MPNDQSIARFIEGGIVTAILDWPSGKLTLKDGGASLEMYDSWKDYVKGVTASDPVKGDVQEIINQLSLTLGEAQIIGEDNMNGTETVATPVGKAAVVKKGVAKKALVSISKAEKPAKAVVVKKEKEPAKPPVPCACGCNYMTNSGKSRFLPGHDAKFHSQCRKVERGEMKFNELSAEGQAIFKEEGRRANSVKTA